MSGSYLGIDFSEVPGNTWPKPGDKMEFTGAGGYASEKKRASEVFVIGQIYTVQEIDIGRSDHRISFEEHPERSYNGCLFTLIPEAEFTEVLP